MIKIVKILFILPLVFFPIISAASLETGGVDNIFSFGAGLRALGMGGAFTAMENDATLAYWNPGATPFNQYKEIALFGTRTIASSYYFSGFYTNPTINFGTISIGGLGIYSDGIESYDENASPITGAKSNYFHYQVLLSYGNKFKWGLGLGATVKIEQLRITDYKGAGASFDLGAYYNPPEILHWFSIGAVVQDVYGTGIRLEDEFEVNTRIYKAGIATNFYLGKKKNTRLSFALDSRFYNDNYNSGSKQFLYDFSFGSELSFSDVFMLRMGYKNFTPDSIFQNLPQGISAGLGIQQWGFGIDYAVSFEESDWQGLPELLMRVGISYKFGKSMIEKEKDQAEEIRIHIEKEIKKVTENFDVQQAELKEKLEQEIRETETKYQEEIASLDTASEQEKVALASKLGEDYQKSIDELNRQYEQERSALEIRLSEQRSDYEQQIVKIEVKSSLKDKLIADEAFKSEKYALGLQLYSDGEYEEALAEFETVARFDPNYLNIQEYINRTKGEMRDVSTYSPEILTIYYEGIDLFVQKKYEEAINEWNKMLEIDPYNKLARRNIKEASDRLKKLKELGISK